MFVNFNILNQLGSPAINSNTFANRPAAGQTGRLFVSTDTFEIYRDNGTTWDLIGGPGSSTITGTGTATQVAYFTSSQAIGSDSNLFWDNANIRLGIGTSSPGARLDIHGSGVVGQFNGTTSASNIFLALQRGGVNLWRIGDMYNSGQNYFEIRNSVLSNNAVEISAATNKTTFLANESYSSGQAQGNLFTYNLTAPAGATFTSPNAVSAVNAYLNLSLGGNATMPAGTRQGIEGNSRLSFTGAGTLTMSQGSTLRAYAAITGVHSFAGSAVGTITHLAGMRLCFPDNVGSAVSVTNNYGLLINDQSAGTGTITYTNRWGIYQEGASDLNYFAANMLLGSTVNSGNYKLQVTGKSKLNDVYVGGTDGGTYSTYTDGVFGDNLHIAATGTTGAVYINTGLSRNTYINPVGGNVGIGTTSPSGLLQLNGSIASSGDAATFTIKQSSTTYTNGIYLERGGERNGYYMYIGGGADALTFRRNYFGTQSDVMSLTRDGNVGIGTTSPSTALEVAGSVRAYLNSATSTELFAENNTVKVRLIAGTSSSFLSTTTNHPLIFETNNTERARITSGGNVLIGSTTDNGRKLQVNGNVTAATIEQSQTNATAIVTLAGNSNQQGNANNYTIVRAYPVVSLGTKLIIPFVSQGNLNSTTICKIFGHSAKFNDPNPIGFEITFAVGHLTTLSNLNSWGGNGNYASIAINGMNVEITFTSAYTSATSNGIYATIEYMTNVPSYSIDVANIAMN